MTTDGGIELAYAELGSGEHTVVRVTGLGPSLDDVLDGTAYSVASTWMVARLPESARVVLFDRRGQGLSTRTFGFGTLEDRMDDIRVVMDETVVDQAVLVADFDSVCLALLFAATYPERVSGLVLRSAAGHVCVGHLTIRSVTPLNCSKASPSGSARCGERAGSWPRSQVGSIRSLCVTPVD